MTCIKRRAFQIFTKRQGESTLPAGRNANGGCSWKQKFEMHPPVMDLKIIAFICNPYQGYNVWIWQYRQTAEPLNL
jgi:hypothetical protein